jgi:Spy/CpxP family protein refolding chaperone
MTQITVGIAAAALTLGTWAAVIVAAQETDGPRRPFMAQRGGPGGPGRFGGPGRGGPIGPPGAMGPLGGLPLGQLELTTAQREQVRSITDARQDEMRALGERAMAAREALHVATTSATLDEALVRTRASELAAAEAEIAVAQARIYAEVFQILTAEQQAKVKEIQQQRQERADQRRTRLQERQNR